MAENHTQAILGFKACRDLNLLTVDEAHICAMKAWDECLTEAAVAAEYADLFEGLGHLQGEVHLHVNDKVPPVQMPLRRLPLGVRDKVGAELRRLEELGVIESVSEPSPWISALLVVAKPDGRIRICIDPKPLNKALLRVPYCMPTIDDILPQLTGARVFSTCDAKDGFWHLSLDPASSRLTTFETPFGRKRWLRLPFGISASPEIFQSRIHAALSGLKGIACIADDILIYGAGETDEIALADHNANLRALLERCREKGIKLNRQKLRLYRESTLFCGHELTKSGVRADQRKVDAIKHMPAPTDRQGVLRLLGMATYLAKFCPQFSEITAPIRALLKGENEFYWNPDVQGKALQKLKVLLMNAPVLGYFDTKKQTVVQCDASQAGLGAVLLQEGRPVEYASRALTATEQSYSQIEKEELAICFAMERFHTYVYARHVVIETDHKPLIAIAKKSLASAPRRLQRMLLRLQRYNYDLVYKPGSKVVLADALSRAYPPHKPGETITEFPAEIAALMEEQQMAELTLVASDQTIRSLMAAAAADEEYKQLLNQIKVGFPPSTAELPPAVRPYAGFADELAISGGLIFKGHRVIIPYPARADILRRLHSSHIGINGCLRRAKESVYYPGLSADIKALVSGCSICSMYQTETQKEPLMPHSVPPRPWEKIGVDIFTFQGQDFLISVDYLSGYFEVDRLASKRVRDITYILRQKFAVHGIPLQVVSDNQPFGSTEFLEFAAAWEFQSITSSPRYAQSNGRAENAVKTAKRLMTKASEAGSDVYLSLLAWRNTPSAQTNQSPAQLMFGRNTRTLLPMAAALLAPPAAAGAHSALMNAKDRQAQYYDRRAKERPPLQVGQTVRARYHAGDWRKAQITRLLPHRSY